MWGLCLLVLACKEDQVYTVGVIALLMRDYGAPEVRKHWRFLVYLAGAWFLVGTGIVQQHFRDYGYTDFVYYRWLFGLDPALPVSLSTVVAAIFRPDAVLVVAVLIAGLAALPLLASRWLLLTIPPYLANVLSEHIPQNDLGLHYALLLLFPLMVAAAVGARGLLERRTIRPALGLAAIAPALLLAWTTGTLPPALQANDRLYSHPNTLEQLQAATAMIPAGAPVNADSALTVWLADRHTINDFPDHLDGSCYVVIDRQAFISGPTHPDQRNAAIQQLGGSGRRILYDDGRFQTWSPIGG
jgi:hypothetical protein